MGATTGSEDCPEGDSGSVSRRTRELVRQSLLSGVAIVVPLLVTLLVLGLFVEDDPLSELAGRGGAGAERAEGDEGGEETEKREGEP